MLKIINGLSVFFEDCYREISVREYSREVGVSPPTASKMLKEFAREGLLLSREDRGFLLFRVNRESGVMRDLSRIYWGGRLGEFFSYVEKNLFPKAIVLFGSLSKLEVRKESDIDVMILGGLEKEFDISKFEKKFKREIQIFAFDSLEKVNKELRANVINAYVVGGYMS